MIGRIRNTSNRTLRLEAATFHVRDSQGHVLSSNLQQNHYESSCVSAGS